MPYLSFLFICIVWGTSFILMERASHALGPVTIATCRLLGGALVLAIYWLFNRQTFKLNLAAWGHILVVALLANILPFVIQPYVMMQAGEHAYFGMLVALVPLATIMASIPMLGIWPSRRQLIGVLGAFFASWLPFTMARTAAFLRVFSSWPSRFPCRTPSATPTSNGNSTTCRRSS
ncbi:MAG: DMT family transporter [Planctomycetes bacterium]|nr:DMT family transporter [Planctomycetota bacterium]